MHILTGMIVSALLRRRAAANAESGPELPRLRTGPVRVLHQLPGRVRFQVPTLRNHGDDCSQLTATLGDLDGIESATANPATGTVLVRHDPARVAPAVVLGAVARLLGLPDPLRAAPTPVVTRELRDLGASLNRVVLEETHGLVDLRTAAFLSLAAFGTHKLITEKGSAMPTGVTLLWWAVHSLAGKHDEAMG